LTSSGPLLLIFHEAAPETDYFSKETDITPWLTSIPTSKLYTKSRSASEEKKKDTIQPHYPVIIQDTQRLYAAYVAQPQAAQVSLSRACKEQNIPVNRMNNAGMYSIPPAVPVVDPDSSPCQAMMPTTSFSYMIT
jgi:hypothetical protein